MPRPLILFPKPGSFNWYVRRRIRTGNIEFYSFLADKYRVRDYIAERGRGVRLSTLYHVTKDPETIPFDKLPPSYVIKANNGSGRLIIVREGIDGLSGKPAEPEKIRKTCRRWLRKRNITSLFTGELHYRRIAPLIIVEEFLSEQESLCPKDYKFYVFHGKPLFVEVHSGRYEKNHGCRIYDENFRELDLLIGDPISRKRDLKPDCFEEMKEIASSLAQGLDFVRIDLYCLGETIYFGECTLTPAAGFARFVPQRYDMLFGALWENNTTRDNTKLTLSSSYPEESFLYCLDLPVGGISRL
ncbi:MAG: hypothetical protein JW760_09975 [Spirochaetales bacterium]|nr:hypothetical protein [Spirochaetales bacterium]